MISSHPFIIISIFLTSRRYSYFPQKKQKEEEEEEEEKEEEEEEERGKGFDALNALNAHDLLAKMGRKEGFNTLSSLAR